MEKLVHVCVRGMFLRLVTCLVIPVLELLVFRRKVPGLGLPWYAGGRGAGEGGAGLRRGQAD